MKIVQLILKKLSISSNLEIKKINNIIELPQENFFTNRIELYRTYEYLNWRFFKNPQKYDLYKIEFLDEYIGYIVFSETLRNNQLALYITDFNLKKKYTKFIGKILINILLSKYDINKYSFVASWLSKKSLYWDEISKFLPINKKDISFIVHKKLLPKCFSKIDNDNLHFVIGDGDNI